MLSRSEIDEIEARAEKATPGPWYRVEGMLKHYIYSENRDLYFSLQELHQEDGREWPTVETAEFIITARTDVPALCATVRELRKVLKLAQTCQHCIGAEMDACYRCEHEIPRRVREMLK